MWKALAGDALWCFDLIRLLKLCSSGSCLFFFAGQWLTVNSFALEKPHNMYVYNVQEKCQASLTFWPDCPGSPGTPGDPYSGKKAELWTNSQWIQCYKILGLQKCELYSRVFFFNFSNQVPSTSLQCYNTKPVLLFPVHSQCYIRTSFPSFPSLPGSPWKKNN